MFLSLFNFWTCQSLKGFWHSKSISLWQWWSVNYWCGILAKAQGPLLWGFLPFMEHSSDVATSACPQCMGSVLHYLYTCISSIQVLVDIWLSGSIYWWTHALSYLHMVALSACLGLYYYCTFFTEYWYPTPKVVVNSSTFDTRNTLSFYTLDWVWILCFVFLILHNIQYI